jgi:hypothetical protein
VFNNMSDGDLLAIYTYSERNSVHYRPGHAGRSPTYFPVRSIPGT